MFAQISQTVGTLCETLDKQKHESLRQDNTLNCLLQVLTEQAENIN